MELSRCRHGFARVELGATLAIALVIIAVLLPMSDRQRRLARLGIDMASLRQIGEWTGQYAADHGERYATFSWRAGPLPVPAGDPFAAGLPATFATHLEACRGQMTYLARSLSGNAAWPSFTSLSILPNTVYSHWVLVSYAGLRFSAREFVSSADAHRRRWVEDPAGYNSGAYLPNLGFSFNPSWDWRHPYGASFRTPAAMYDRSPFGMRVYPASSTGTIGVPFESDLSGNLLSDAKYPSQKVMLYDTHARHFSSVAWYATDPNAQLPLVFVDGHVAVHRSANANPGSWPDDAMTGTIPYSASPIDPPGTSSAYVVPFGLIWTKNRLQGRDFGGPEPAFVP